LKGEGAMDFSDACKWGLLTNDERQCLSLRWYGNNGNGMTEEEIATITRWTVKKIRELIKTGIYKLFGV
jgi:DNA-directed RNA polymerase sigma subunit (sigma70/sigma32)